MKLLLLCTLVLLASAAPSRARRMPRGIKGLPKILQRFRSRGYDGSSGRQNFLPAMNQRSAADMAAMFPGMDPEIATATADALIAAGIDKNTMTASISKTNPEMMMTAVTTIGDAIIKAVVPVGCTDAMAVHMVAGFARHIFMEAMLKDFIHIVEECTERDHLHGRTAGRASGAPTMDQWRTVITTLKAAMNAKLAAWIPATGTVDLMPFFDATMSAIDIGTVKDVTMAELCAMLAKAHIDFLGKFTGTATTCDVGGTFADLAAHVTDLTNFMTVDAINMLANADVPAGARPMIVAKITRTLGMVAGRLTTIINAYHTGDVAGFMAIIRMETFDELIISTKIIGIVNGLMTADFIEFVNGKIAAGQTENMLKMVLRTVALTMADMDIGEKEIDGMLTAAIQIIIGEAIPSRERLIFSLLAVGISAGISLGSSLGW